jgi:hypothetical protein
LKAARNQTSWKDAIANHNAQVTEGVANVGRIKAEETRRNADPTGVYAAAELARKKAHDGKDSKAAETALQKATAEIAPMKAAKPREELASSSEGEEAYMKAADHEAYKQR